ncbi:uncharacterized protein LOC141607953 [Silene latifolia]|uniref:uncharacterized protein LOC141607953 n=1 Tax=Silene latifolia TaxID=37657 RepID=UPI003D777755
MEHYTIKAGYQWLKPDGALVTWFPWMLNDWIIPKHSFCCWLIAHRRLLTLDRLMKMNIVQGNTCFLCGLQEESIDHLFFLCPYSAQCHRLVAEWCKVQLPMQDCISWWIKYRQAAACKKKVLDVVLACLMYHLWHCRNSCRLEGYVLRPKCLVGNVMSNVRMRLAQCDIKSRSNSALSWVEYLRSN